MAIIKHIPVKNRYYSQAVEYLTCKFDEYRNQPIVDDKGRIQERDSYLIEGVNGDFNSFGAECIETNRFYGKNNGIKDVKAHQYIISFSKDDRITMEQAINFGKEWLKTFAPGHQAVIAAHPDGHNGSQNIHVHIVINSVRKHEGVKSVWHEKACEWKQGCKHKSTGKMMYHAKKWVMRQCITKGYSQVDLLAKKHHDNYWVEKRRMDKNAMDGIGITSNRELIRTTIDKFVDLVDSFEQLIELLQGFYRWKIRVTNKSVTFTLPEMKQGIRGNKLGDGYSKAELAARIVLAKKERDNTKREADRIAVEQREKEAEERVRQKEKEDAARREKVKQEKKEQAEEIAREEKNKKRKLVFQRNQIQSRFLSEVLYSDTEWNKEYAEYLQKQYISDPDSVTEEQLREPILTREKFDKTRIPELQKERAKKAHEMWCEALDHISGVECKWKWKYLDYLETVTYADVTRLSLYEVKEPVMSYNEFATIKDREENASIQNEVVEVEEIRKETEMVSLPVYKEDTTDNKREVFIAPDWINLSVEERARILSVPTDDINAELHAYLERMADEEKDKKGIHNKMEKYDEFLKEYEIRKKICRKQSNLFVDKKKERDRGR